MKKSVEVLFVMSVFFIFIILFSLYIISADVDESKIDENVIQKVQSEDEARVLITIKNDTTWYGENNFEGNKDEVSDIVGDNLKHEFDNKLSADVSQEDLANLAINSNVESVSLVGVKKLFLTQATPLINATNSWSIKVAGTNITG